MTKSGRKPESSRRALVPVGDNSSNRGRSRSHHIHSPNVDRKPSAPRDGEDDRKPSAPSDDNDDSDGTPDAGTGRAIVNDMSMQRQHRQQSGQITSTSRQPQTSLCDTSTQTLPSPTRPLVVPPLLEGREAIAPTN